MSLSAFLCCGCGHASFDHLETRDGSPLTHLAVPAGTSAPISVMAIDTSGEEMMCDVAFTPRDESILLTERAISGPIVLVGLAPGKTVVTVYCDGDVVGSIDAEVTDRGST